MKKEIFGYIENNPIYKYTISDGKITASVLNYGAVWHSFVVSDQKKGDIDLIIGYKNLEDYVNRGGYLGAIVGRVANRIAFARFTMNGKTYNLSKNNGEHSLHGGENGFNRKIWQEVKLTDDSVTLKYISADGEEGYPAEVEVFVTYTVTDNGVKIDYKATPNGDTPLGLINHAYFNPNGENGGACYDVLVQLDADSVVPVNQDRVADGKLMKVEGTVFDFRKPRKLGDFVHPTDPTLQAFRGYDICYALNGSGFRKVGEVTGDKSGITMEVYTDMEGLQLYASRVFVGVEGKTCTLYEGNSFCLETQHYPNAVNCPNFPSPFVKKGQTFTSTTFYKVK
ncbi:MAG: galactose mutarotase [Clostridia bacterium]|nr:galactose mutarotase [Clostridia bacterium]